MYPYLQHLFSDITAAYRTEILSVIERWVEGEEPAHTFGYYCGLETINFPPAEQLTDKKMKQIITAFRKMMFSWNLCIDLPEPLPVWIANKMTVDTLDIKTGIVNSGMMIHFDFCTGYALNCVLKNIVPTWNSGMIALMKIAPPITRLNKILTHKSYAILSI